jgi:signal transduction histidine kinase
VELATHCDAKYLWAPHFNLATIDYLVWLCLFFAGWMLFGATMWLNLKRTLTSERELTLIRRIDRLQELLHKNQTEDAAERYQDFEDFAHATGNGLSEIFLPNGVRAYPSPSPAAQAFPWPAINSNVSEQFIHVYSCGQPYLVLIWSFSLRGQSLFLFAAAPETGNILVLQSFWKVLLASAPILLLISSAGGYWVSRKALRPVDRITATARSISIRNLSERVPVADTGDELQRLAETCNAMLGRLELAVTHMRRFTADASHELRGPLSFTRTVAEVAMRNPNADPESRRAFEDIVGESAKATVLLEQMLNLARADSGAFNRVLEPINLAAVIEEACALARPLADERSLTLSLAGTNSPVIILGDFSSLRRLLWILLDNALKYTFAPGLIEVTLGATAEQTILLVRDTGIGITPADLPFIFDRFYRADPSRSQVEGNGLGLAIAKWIAEMHHADLSVISKEHSGTSFRLVLPPYDA